MTNEIRVLSFSKILTTVHVENNFEVFNGGKDYDVVNPPQIEISAGTGTTALFLQKKISK